ncbi:piggyBac transposable element-derived protein 4-like [Engraulis encrasicolus]|uniref:piggyBac transposable element-derived protein 4-like n=1 Tax=Engraulis encrasicolus TaxID=184585 RepID=UPI002FD6BC62
MDTSTEEQWTWEDEEAFDEDSGEDELYSSGEEWGVDGGYAEGSVDSELEEAFEERMDILLDADETSDSLLNGTFSDGRPSPSIPSTPPSARRGASPRKRPWQAPTSTPSPSAKRRLSHSMLSPSKQPPSDGTEMPWNNANTKDVEPPPFIFRPKRTPGPQLEPQMDYRPLDLFQLFFSKEVVKTLCKHTNLYAARKTAEGRRMKWVDVEVDEMYRYLSLIIYQGLVKTSCLHDPWRKDRLYRLPFPHSVMTGKRYHAISASLHMSDPAVDAENDKMKGQPGYEALCRLQPLHDDILTACRAYFHPRQNLSVDERMVASKARIRFKQYIKNKPTKWGFKLFVLADSSNGYTCDFSIYGGKTRATSGQGLGFDAVVNLLHVPSLGTGYNVYVDNFYTSSKLFLHLRAMSYGACGTMRQNLRDIPQTQTNALPRNAARGDMRWIRDGPLLFVKWKDARDVAMCSTIHKAWGGQTAQRRIKDKDSGKWLAHQVPVPEPITEYNKFMGGVDLSDALIKYYSVTQKTMRWYMKLFLHFLDIAVVNSFILYKEMALARGEKNPPKQKAFREDLCRQLADYGKLLAPESEPPLAALPHRAEDKKLLRCFPVPTVETLCPDPTWKSTKGRRKCVLCKKQTIYKCRSCDVALCLIVDRLCFTAWHDEKDMKEAEKQKNTEKEALARSDD